jgi:hypothetical protein
MTTLNLLIQLAIQYLRMRCENLALQNKTYFFDILDKFDARIDKLDAQREKLRKSPSPADQDQAEKLFNEILEEKKKMSLWQKELASAKKDDTVKP